MVGRVVVVVLVVVDVVFVVDVGVDVVVDVVVDLAQEASSMETTSNRLKPNQITLCFTFYLQIKRS